MRGRLFDPSWRRRLGESAQPNFGTTRGMLRRASSFNHAIIGSSVAGEQQGDRSPTRCSKHTTAVTGQPPLSLSLNPSVLCPEETTTAGSLAPCRGFLF